MAASEHELDVSCPNMQLINTERKRAMRPKYGWKAEASKKSGWFEKPQATRAKRVLMILAVFATMLVFAFLASYFG